MKGGDPEAAGRPEEAGGAGWGRREPPRRAAIVLAGGRSRRFGADKLLADLDGRPLLWHALEPLAPLVDELVVAIGPDAPVPAVPRLDPAPHIVRDAVPDGGPLVGLLAGLRAISAPIVLVVGGDMPMVRPAVLEALAAAIEAGGLAAPVAALLEGSALRPLPLALRAESCRDVAERLVAAGERSLRSLVAATGAIELHEPAWRSLDPEAASLRDVDTARDLEALEKEKSRRPQ